MSDNVEVFYYQGEIEALKDFLSTMDIDFPVRKHGTISGSRTKFNATIYRSDGVIHLLKPGDVLVYDYDDNTLHTERVLF